MRDFRAFSQNRLFNIIAVGLVALLIFGLLGIGGLIFYTRLRGPATPTMVAEASPTSTATPTPIKTATAIPTPKATLTPVVPSPSPTSAATPTPTPTEEGVPETGWGIWEAIVGGSILGFIIWLSRRLRFAGRN